MGTIFFSFQKNTITKMSITIITWLFSFALILHISMCESKFWGKILPLACESSCKQLKKDKPELKYDHNKDDTCESFCEPIVKVLLTHKQVGKALAVMPIKWGLNLMQWAMRDTALAIAEQQPIPFCGEMFLSRLAHYEAQMESSEYKSVQEASEKIASEINADEAEQKQEQRAAFEEKLRARMSTEL